MVKSSSPSSPNNARVLKPSWKIKPASLAAALLLRVTRRSPVPGVTSSWLRSTASDLTARRFSGRQDALFEQARSGGKGRKGADCRPSAVRPNDWPGTPGYAANPQQISGLAAGQAG